MLSIATAGSICALLAPRITDEYWAFELPGRDAGRDRPPVKWAGFGYSLAPDAETRLHRYVYEYLQVAGEKIATAVASAMTRSTLDAVRESMEAYAELDVDQIVLVPATADLAELELAQTLIAAF